MAASFDLKNDGVVVIIGSGAGGGTLGNELAQKGIDVGVTGTNNWPRLPGNNNFKVLKAGADKLGYKECHTGNMAINSVERDDRNSCQQTGFCFQGCKWGAKWSTLYTEIPKGEATGHLEVRPNSMAIKISHDASGKVTGVVYADKDGKLQEQKARIVAVAGNSIESPRLLLNSESSKFPHGLANSSGQVGKNYMRHTTGSVYAIFDKPVHMYRGTTMAGIIRDEARHDPSRGFVGGYEMETLSLGLPFMAAFLNPGGWGRSFTTALDHYDHMAGLWIVGEDMPREENRITLHKDEKDEHGMPIADVHFDDHPNDEAMREHAYKQGQALYAAVGATRTFPTPPYPSTHNLGTNRMSEKPEDGVVNKHGQSHDIKNLFVSDGSQFTSGAAENPTLTIVTLAIRQADYIAAQMSAKTI
ncbi:GMC family oxidoreductase [Mesorhizobium sp. B2-4-6]|uniref:GMC family oxidoreductase n=1 Tax=Mesorhizobium sp. B2-4-6 TaxID=2589943 RepID=UPI001125C9C7|nr:GMC family oxidoreductase [Mesorhizobium sp. B2-4-6]TPL51469.1 GMC family oxidoreductase [Mesorhizobium sp. B2-4-6]